MIRRKKLIRIGVVFQKDLRACGVAALKMIFDYYNKVISFEEIKKNIIISDVGISAKNLLEYVRANGFEAKGIKGSIRGIIKMKAPLILHLKYNHYVVYTGYKLGNIFYIDPLEGRKKLFIADFEKLFSGIALQINPVRIEYTETERVNIFKKYSFDFLMSSKLFIVLVSVQFLSNFIVNLYDAKEGITNYSRVIFLILYFLFVREWILRDVINRNLVDKSMVYQEKLFRIPIVYFMFDRLGVNRSNLNSVIVRAIVNFIYFVLILIFNILFSNSLSIFLFLILCNCIILVCFVIYDKYIYYLSDREQIIINKIINMNMSNKYLRKTIIFEVLIATIIIVLYILIANKIDYKVITNIIINIICFGELTYTMYFLRKSKQYANEKLMGNIN